MLVSKLVCFLRYSLGIIEKFYNFISFRLSVSIARWEKGFESLAPWKGFGWCSWGLGIAEIWCWFISRFTFRIGMESFQISYRMWARKKLILNKDFSFLWNNCDKLMEFRLVFQIRYYYTQFISKVRFWKDVEKPLSAIVKFPLKNFPYCCA